MSWASLHYLISELVYRKLVQSSKPFEDIQKYIHYTSTYSLEHQTILTPSDVLDHTDDDKIYKQECGLIDSALINIEPGMTIVNYYLKEIK